MANKKSSKRAKSTANDKPVAVACTRLLEFLSQKSSHWAMVAKESKRLTAKRYAQGCMMAYLTAEDWVNNNSNN